MKKYLVISSIAAVVLLALSTVGLALAQSPQPTQPTNPQTPSYAPGMMGRWGGRGPGMMGPWARFSGMMRRFLNSPDNDYPPMHEYMEEAWAKTLGLSHDELEQRLDAGETLWSIAQAQGITQENFGKLMLQARTEALNKMVADGVLTQEQADWMINRMNQNWEYRQNMRPGFGGCPMGGGRWYTQPTQPAQPSY